jgi:hypothetical protein
VQSKEAGHSMNKNYGTDELITVKEELRLLTEYAGT